jgi:hypothetical protein
LLLLVAPGTALAENVDPAGDASQYAWGENAGWVNAEPSGNGGPGLDVQDFAVSGWMWGENLGWVSLSCANTSSCATVSYGIVNDGFGTLSGDAWAENAGWIRFDPTFGGVTIDPATGNFGGRAWGENAGWVTFASAGPVAYKVRTAWCQNVAAAPATPTLTLAKVGGDDCELSWTVPASAAWYDVVRGDLGVLRASGGDFTAATQSCLDEDTLATSHVFSGDPPAGGGFWFLVRGVNCKGRGPYDSGGAGQVSDRDAEIDAAGPACQ